MAQLDLTDPQVSKIAAHPVGVSTTASTQVVHRGKSLEPAAVVTLAESTGGVHVEAATSPAWTRALSRPMQGAFSAARKKVVLDWIEQGCPA